MIFLITLCESARKELAKPTAACLLFGMRMHRRLRVGRRKIWQKFNCETLSKRDGVTSLRGWFDPTIPDKEFFCFVISQDVAKLANHADDRGSRGRY